VAVIGGLSFKQPLAGIAFHPSEQMVAIANGHVINVYRFDLAQLLGTAAARPAVRYTSAKIVVVGESGVGKTGLGWRLSQGEFKEHASTHGQQFWLLDELGMARADGTECEAVLWDLAGQPDYRLIHALFLDDADLALVVFDPSRDEDPLRTVDYWLRQLRAGEPDAPRIILVAARVDRGGLRITDDEIRAFCRRRGISDLAMTSALSGLGLSELTAKMRAAIDWESRPSTITTETFKEIKDYVLGLKEAGEDVPVILSPSEPRATLERAGVAQGFTDAEMTTAVGHLAKHGYVSWLRGSDGVSSILFAPELLNNLAASLVLAARRNSKGLGSLEEKPLLAGEYRFSELDGLPEPQRQLLLDSAVAMFLSHNICFRSVDQLSGRTYLVFPDLINLQRPSIQDDVEVEEVVSYGVTGAVENLYASVVVVLGYTSTFTRTNQWRNHARYVVGENLVCDLRVESEREAELTFVLSFGRDVGANVRTLFQSLVESLLTRRDLTVRRYPEILCGSGHRLSRAVMRDRLAAGFAFCPSCGERLPLPRADVPIALTTQLAEATVVDRRVADTRSRFEEAVFRLATYVTQDGPTCFISYAWGDPAQERWVEHNLADDLLKARIRVILDRWENARFGASVHRFVERIHDADRVIVVGTPAYKTKYVNDEPMRGFVVAAEGDLIGKRMLGTEAQKATVLPILLAGEATTSLPPLLQGRVYADFRDPDDYFETAFDLMLSLHGLNRRDPGIADLRAGIVRGNR
jgi:small GTP-binding protein